MGSNMRKIKYFFPVSFEADQEIGKLILTHRFEDKTEAEWIEECLSIPDSIHAHVYLIVVNYIGFVDH